MSGPLGVLATLVLFVIVLGSLVLIHEIGHFVTARLAGIRVLEFGIGFPPRHLPQELPGRGDQSKGLPLLRMRRPRPLDFSVAAI